MKLGIMLAGRGPEDIARRLEQAREAGFSLCQLNIHHTGLSRADMAAIAASMLEFGVRPVAMGCYVNPLRAEEAGPLGASVADLDLALHSLDILGARRVVFWSGTHADGLYAPHEENPSDDSLAALREFLARVVRETRARRYTLVIEPWRTHVLGSEDRIRQFHRSLPPYVEERVRYVLDAPGLMTPDRYLDRDAAALRICRTVGPLAGLVHLRDVVMPPDGEEALPGPGQGRLDYPAYLRAVFEHVPPDVPAIVRNVPPAEFASARDYLLRCSGRWELA